MRSAEPRFSVVMPAHNAAPTIAAAVKSVLRQTVDDFELIVVDDGSTDDTLESLRPFTDDPRVIVLSQRQKGPSAARNAGIEAASTPTISVIDSDDLWLPTYLETMGSTLASRPDAGFAYTDAWLFDDRRQLVSRRPVMETYAPVTAPSNSGAFLLKLLDRNFVYTSATIPRDVLLEVGGYDDRLRYGEDFELWVRIVETGRMPVRVPATLAIHRRTGTSLTADVRRFYAGICDVYSLILAEHQLDSETRALGERRLAYWRSHRDQLERPGIRTRAGSVARHLRSHTLGRRDWLQRPPAAVAATLSHCGVT